MNTTFITRLTRSVLPVALLVMTAGWQAPALAATNCAGEPVSLAEPAMMP